LNVRVFQEDLTRGWRQHSIDEAQGGCFARPTATEQYQRLAWLQGEAQIIEDGPAADAVADVFK
jgi:hypothetical protein